jgi:RimJ/RimL family protein N-acetyltransferase
MAEEDVEELFTLMSDDYTARRAGFKPFTTKERTLVFMKNWKRDSYIITERCSDNVIGLVQTPYFFMGHRNDIVEYGYWLAEEHRGKGYMTEAIEALKEYFFETDCCVGEQRIHIFSGNEASKKVALKCGFYPMYEAYVENVYNRYGTVESEECFSILREDYEWQKRGVDFYSTAQEKAAA